VSGELPPLIFIRSMRDSHLLNWAVAARSLCPLADSVAAVPPKLVLDCTQGKECSALCFGHGGQAGDIQVLAAARCLKRAQAGTWSWGPTAGPSHRRHR
jgi:hypothetical protein